VSVVIPTRARNAYLEVALASIVPQASAAGAEVVVIDDAGPSERTRELVTRAGARYEPHDGPRGLNVARNTGVERSAGDLVVFVDDDVRAHGGWLDALIAAADANPLVDVFAGRIAPSFEGAHPRSCGLEASPITTLELGDEDRETRFAWGANMAIRRGALERVGPFDTSLEDGGDEQEWQERLRSQRASSRVIYVARAVVDHRRTGADARLPALARAAYRRGRASRRFDAWRGEAPSAGAELLTLAGCVAHVVRRRCPAGLTMVAHSAGRLRESRPAHIASAATRARAAKGEQTTTGTTQPGAGAQPGPSDDFLAGSSGTVGGVDAARRAMLDAMVNTWELASGRRLRLALAARARPPARRVLVLGVERPEHLERARRAQRELFRSRHQVELYTTPPGDRGKFENLNRLLAEHPAEGHDWLLLLDDDVELPRGFLDRFLFLCERFALQLAQPAHLLNSHAAWPQTRRRATSIVHETAFVEIGPLTALASATFATLLPFPDLRMGWGLDAHWAAVAREHGWRLGVTDAVAIGHRVAAAGEHYSREQSIAEARSFLRDRPYLPAAESRRTLATHRRW
jgi:GT2 family glycosyltransferase